MTQLSVVGKSVKKLDDWEKVTGRAKYCDDFGISGILHIKILRSPYAHAKIKRIDTSLAEKMPGVRAVVTGQDAPNVRFGLILKDQYVLARDNRVRAVGEAIAAVAADTVEIAEDALQLIKVEYKELPAIFDPEVSMQLEPPVVIHPEYEDYYQPELYVRILKEGKRPPNVANHVHIHDGDTEKGFKDSDLIIENKFLAPRVHHCQLETHRADGWVKSDGTLVIRTSTQGPWMVEGVLEDLFKLPAAKIRVLSSFVGGGFGGKQGVIIEPIVALLAMKTGRPVRLVLTREEQFIDSHQRTAVITYIKDGIKKDGTIIARKMKIIVDLGRHAESALATSRFCGYSGLSTYSIPNFTLDSYGVYTNNPITSPFRGIGVPEITWGIEQQMDIIAEKVGIDPVELRRRHILKEGEVDASGRVTQSIGARECLDKVAEWIEWGKITKQDKGPWRKGKGIAIGNKFTTAGWYSAASVKVHPDATIEIRHGGIDMGQGLNTVLAQIVAEEFQTSTEHVKVVFGDTAFTPFDESSVSSRCTIYAGNAVRRACQDAKRQVFDIAAGILGLNPAALEINDGVIYSPTYPGKSLKVSNLFAWRQVALRGGEIVGRDYFTSPVIYEDPKTGRSPKPVTCYTYGANAVEVAVNIETGQVKVLRIIGAFDNGISIHPKMVEGQIEGGIGMGIGLSLYEEIVLKNGVVVNPNFMDYKLPKATEMPSNKSVKTMTIEVPYGEGPFGAKGIGESTIVPIAPAIGNAIYNAVGIRIDSIPMSAEKIWRKIKEVSKDVNRHSGKEL
jgi:CO/xanthine dehydrogenase Mo-binding subunit